MSSDAVDGALAEDDQPVGSSELKDSVKGIKHEQPLDGKPLDMVEDMSPEKGPFGGTSEAAPLLSASGWHPFMHFFVKVSNMMHGSADPCDRAGMLKTEYPRFFIFSWVMDEILEVVVVVLSVVFISIIVEKAIGVSFPVPLAW